MDDPGKPALANARRRAQDSAYGIGATYVGPADRSADFDGWRGTFAVADASREVLLVVGVASEPGFDTDADVDVEAAAELIESMGAGLANDVTDRVGLLVSRSESSFGLDLKGALSRETVAPLLRRSS